MRLLKITKIDATESRGTEAILVKFRDFIQKTKNETSPKIVRKNNEFSPILENF